MKKIILTVFLLVCLSYCAFCEAEWDIPGLPEGSVLIGEAAEPSALYYRINENMFLLRLEDGQPISLEGEAPTEVFDLPQDPDEATRVLQAHFPNALILVRSDSGETDDASSPSVRFSVITEALCGDVVIAGNAVADLQMRFGNYIRDGRLTGDGAAAAMACYRPEARITEMELDNDDGMMIYEGEAMIGGSEYEFEIHAETARLLEWERD